MNILTKIWFVLLVVASLVASVVFISLATVHPNYRSLFEQEQQAYGQLASTCRGLMETTDRLGGELKEAREERSNMAITLRTEADILKAKNTRLEVQNATLKTNINSINDDLTVLSENDKAKQAFIESQQKRLKATWDRETKQQQEMIRISDSWKDERIRAERLEKNLRVTKEQNENQKNIIDELNQRLADIENRIGVEGIAEEEQMPPTPEQKVTGTVTAFRNNLASINIGSAHGLKKGMQLIVYRGDQFVGYLKIELVRINEASGVMIRKILTPKQGDKVTSSLY